MAIALRGSAQRGDGAGGNVVVNKPTGVIDGDFLVAWGIINTGHTVNSPPGGWTAGPTETSGQHTFYSWTKRASSEPTSWTWGLSGFANGTIAVLAFSGVDTTTALDVSTTSQPAAQAATVTVIGATTITDNAWFVALAIQQSGGYDNTWTHPSGFTEDADLPVPSGGAFTNSLAAAHKIITPAGSTGNATWTNADSGSIKKGVGVFLRPASSDTTAPTVTINQAAEQSDPTSTSPINFTATFSEAVTGFTSGDVSISGTAGGTKSVTIGSPTMVGATQVYNVAVSGMTTAGTVIASIPAGVVVDGASNANTASTSTDNTVQWSGADTTAPTVTINQAAGQADPTNTSPINFTVVFSESVSGFSNTDVTISGTAGGTKVVNVTGSGTTYNVAVSGMTTKGTVIATVPAGGATDAAGNANLASTSTDNSVLWDATPPVFSTVEVNGATLTCTADEPLHQSFVPLASQFTVTVAGSPRVVNSLTYGNTGAGGVGVVTLTLASAVTAGQTVTLGYSQ